MITLNHTYKDEKQLLKWLEVNEFATKKNCLVQFFCGLPQEEILKKISTLLSSNLKDAHIVGVTTDGEISSSEVSVEEIVISISIFDTTNIKSASVTYSTNSYDMGKEIASLLHSDDTKAMILFSSGADINGEQFLNGAVSVSKGNYIIAGGMAGDNGKFVQVYVSHNTTILPNGAVGIALSGDDLKVANSYKFNWKSIGLPMTITKSEGNRVYTIDEIPAVDMYTRYLSEEASKQLPKIGVEFPLIVKIDDREVARACLGKNDDGSLLYAGDIPQGSVVHFGIGSSHQLLSAEMEDYTDSFTPQSTFIYSCMARRRLLQKLSSLEFRGISSHSSISGFYSYGEFFTHDDKSYLFNQTMTILALSESDKNIEDENDTTIVEYKDARDGNMLHILSHLSNAITMGWQEKLDIEIKERRELDKQLLQHSKLIQMGEMISMIAHQWRQPLNAISATSINLSLLSGMGKLEEEKVEQSSEFIQAQCQKMSATIDTFLNFVKPSKQSKTFHLSHAIQNVMQIMQAQLDSKDISVNITAQEDNISIYGYEDLLEQVLINLIANARDAFDELRIKDKAIDISIVLKDEKPMIIVEDNAGGISKKVSEKIFNPYFTTKEQGKGTGIGLYMSIGIIQKSFNGSLRHLHIDNGSRFEISFNER